MQGATDLALSHLEFEYNCSKLRATRLLLFEIDVGRVPERPATRSLGSCKVQCQAAIDIFEKRAANRRIAGEKIANARADQKYYADRGRKQILFQKEDLVLCKGDSLDVKSVLILRKSGDRDILGFDS